MSFHFFEGPAGSGKTTSLFDKLNEVLESSPLHEHERVLALTKMHGSRRRMTGRLATLPGLKGRYECTTIDSFAWRVIQRWRSLARLRGCETIAEEDYEAVCASAGELLSEAVVSNWVTRTFPIVVIDEMQDSKGAQLAVIQGLAGSATCLAAADAFQDLEGTDRNEAVDWATCEGDVQSLTEVHRTSALGLLGAANALRNGRTIPTNLPGFRLLGAPNKDVAASFVANNLTWWMEHGDIVVLSPVRAANARFVHDLIARVAEKPIGKSPVGPFRVPWESTPEDQCERFIESLNLPPDMATKVQAVDLALVSFSGPSKALQSWIDSQRRLSGRTCFTVGEVRHQIEVIHRRSRAHRRERESRIRAMTIHQAKNREFESVILLWPYQAAAGTVDRQRRLLYNGITRARRQAVVIVQGRPRLLQPPFTAS